MKLPTNMHRVDQIVRVFVSIACIYLGFIATGVIGQPIMNLLVGIFGIINLFSAVTAFCPVYFVSGISTATARKSTRSDTQQSS
ncbi:MAG: DUF2892 domain-containing protein [Gammaproteobacteria bacterium]|nr:DUF2892 domain-containing protein [Gammaproteobacteria bacterium]